MSTKIADQARLDYVKERTERDFDTVLDYLERDAKGMIDDMERLIKNIEAARAREPYTINSLGVAKWRGDDIDSNAAKLETVRERMRMLNWIGEEDANV